MDTHAHTWVDTRLGCQALRAWSLWGATPYVSCVMARVAHRTAASVPSATMGCVGCARKIELDANTKDLVSSGMRRKVAMLTEAILDPVRRPVAVRTCGCAGACSKGPKHSPKGPTLLALKAKNFSKAGIQKPLNEKSQQRGSVKRFKVGEKWPPSSSNSSGSVDEHLVAGMRCAVRPQEGAAVAVQEPAALQECSPVAVQEPAALQDCAAVAVPELAAGSCLVLEATVAATPPPSRTKLLVAAMSGCGHVGEPGRLHNVEKSC